MKTGGKFTMRTILKTVGGKDDMQRNAVGAMNAAKDASG
jgi:hypothetical protein